MTARYNSLTVVLEKDIRDDDAQPLIEAIRNFRGVLSVKPHIATLENHMAQERVRRELVEKLWKVLEK